MLQPHGAVLAVCIASTMTKEKSNMLPSEGAVPQVGGGYTLGPAARDALGEISVRMLIKSSLTGCYAETSITN